MMSIWILSANWEAASSGMPPPGSGAFGSFTAVALHVVNGCVNGLVSDSVHAK